MDRLRNIALVMAAALALTACGSDDPPPTADGTPPAATSDAPPTTPTVVTPSASAAPSASASPSAKPTPKPTPKTTPPKRNTTGFPDASTTGVPAGTALRDVGELSITKAGSVVTGVRAKCIVIKASNVTVRKSLVRGGSCGSDRQVEVADSARNVLLEDVEIDGQNIHARGAALGGSGFTCRRCNIHGAARGVQPTKYVTIEDSYIHDLYGTANSENAAFQTNDGSHLVVRGSTLDMNEVPTGGSALILSGDYAPIDDVLVEGNLFNGGGYAVYAGEPTSDKDASLQPRNARFLNNAFGKKFFPKCGYYGPVAGFNGKMPGNKWSGNYWLDTKRAINA